MEYTKAPQVESEIIRATNNPFFKPAKIQLVNIANGELEQKFRISIQCGFNSVGYADMSVTDLKTKTTYPVLKPNGQTSGEINFKQFNLIEKPTFTEVLRSGWSLSLAIAIDYTASNGVVGAPGSLHTFEDHSN